MTALKELWPKLFGHIVQVLERLLNHESLSAWQSTPISPDHLKSIENRLSVTTLCNPYSTSTSVRQTLSLIHGNGLFKVIFKHPG